VKIFSSPDPVILRESYGTLQVCQFPGEEGVVVIDAKSLTDVIGMVPFHGPGWRRGDTEKFFPVEKMSLMTSKNDDDNDEEDDT